jgi:GDP/UDP-N,N'-diacetylbacillosamine 2-epimerase (hydrolysing)
VRSTNIIDVDYNAEEIKEAVLKCINDDSFLEKVKKCVNPFGVGDTSEKIVKILKSFYEKNITTKGGFS